MLNSFVDIPDKLVHKITHKKKDKFIIRLLSITNSALIKLSVCVFSIWFHNVFYFIT